MTAGVCKTAMLAVEKRSSNKPSIPSGFPNPLRLAVMPVADAENPVFHVILPSGSTDSTKYYTFVNYNGLGLLSDKIDKMARWRRGCPSVLLGIAADPDRLSTFRGGSRDAGATPDFLHRLLAKTFAELGATDPASVITTPPYAVYNRSSRTRLPQNHCLVGPCFRCSEFHAVWKPGCMVIEFFGTDGKLLRAVTLAK